MPCVFGDPYSDSVVDARHEVILKAAYRFAPDRFLEVLEAFIDGQNEYLGTVHVLDRLVPVWDDRTAKLLRAKLVGHGIRPQAFAKILRVLIEAGDDLAVQIATDLVTSMPADPDIDVGRPLAAALQLLSRDAVAGWHIVWQAVEANGGFAQEWFADLARDPYSRTTRDLVQHLREDQLADMYIWLVKNSAATREEHALGTITPEKALVWLSRVVIDDLGKRGTPEASRQIRRIKENLPDQPIEFVEKFAEELARRNTWRPLSPSELLDHVTALHTGPSAEVTSGEVGIPAEGEQGIGRSIPVDQRRFRKEGDVWHLQFDNTPVLVKDRIGMAYIAYLLRSPGTSLGCVELQAAARGNTLRRLRLDTQERTQLDSPGSVPDEILDVTARREYRDRLDSIESELRQANENNDLGQVERLKGEKEFILKELRSATALAGRPRMFTTEAERARKAVAEAIKDALKVIGKHHPQLAKHLRKRIKRGISCCYNGYGIVWEA